MHTQITWQTTFLSNHKNQNKMYKRMETLFYKEIKVFSRYFFIQNNYCQQISVSIINSFLIHEIILYNTRNAFLFTICIELYSELPRKLLGMHTTLFSLCYLVIIHNTIKSDFKDLTTVFQ